MQANSTAGFSIVTYAGTGSNATVGHGLGTAPQTVLIKKYGTGGSNRAWIMYMEILGNTKALFLNDSDPEFTLTDAFNSTSPTSTTFSIGTNGRCNDSGEGYVAYCFAAKQGFSHFGSYTGNNNSDGPFVYTGFKPAWVMTKRTDSSGNWYIYDTERNGASGPNTNQAHKILYSNDSSGEVVNTDRGIDMIAHGFKIRNTLGNTNADGGTYIYWAFATHPFVSSAGVPATAR